MANGQKKPAAKSRLVFYARTIQLIIRLNRHTSVSPANFEERSGTTELKAVDEVAVFETEQLDRHLTGDHFHIRLAAQIAQLGDARHAVVLDGLAS